MALGSGKLVPVKNSVKEKSLCLHMAANGSSCQSHQVNDNSDMSCISYSCWCLKVCALVPCWCRVIVLEDNDVLHIVGGAYGIYNTRQADVETAVPRRLQVLQLEVDQIMKVGMRTCCC